MGISGKEEGSGLGAPSDAWRLHPPPQRLGSLTVKQATGKEHSMRVRMFRLQEAEKSDTVRPADDCVLIFFCLFVFDLQRARCKKEFKKHLKVGCINVA